MNTEEEKLLENQTNKEIVLSAFQQEIRQYSPDTITNRLIHIEDLQTHKSPAVFIELFFNYQSNQNLEEKISFLIKNYKHFKALYQQIRKLQVIKSIQANIDQIFKLKLELSIENPAFQKHLYDGYYLVEQQFAKNMIIGDYAQLKKIIATITKELKESTVISHNAYICLVNAF